MLSGSEIWSPEAGKKQVLNVFITKVYVLRLSA